jgi:hypothetical protein
MNDPEAYDNASILYRASGIGEVHEQDFFPRPDEHRLPYRLVSLRCEMKQASAPSVAAQWVALAIKTTSYLTMNVHVHGEPTVLLQMFVTRDLTKTERLESKANPNR